MLSKEVRTKLVERLLKTGEAKKLHEKFKRMMEERDTTMPAQAYKMTLKVDVTWDDPIPKDSFHGE